MASTNLTRTVVTPTAQKFTFSAWVKRSKIGSRQGIYKVINPSDTASYGYLEFQSDDRLNFDDFNGASSRFTRVSNANFRDTNGWYHIVVSMDATGVTDSEKAKIYVNGEEVAYVGQTNNSLSSLTTLTPGKTFNLGSHGQSNLYFDGSMSHVHFIDGIVYTPSAFGETDATTGIWKIKTSPSVTYGNNGFFILKDGNSVTDQSGNGNNLTVAGGTLTNTEDNPSNVFATYNPLSFNDANGNWALGNTEFNTGASAYRSTFSNLGANAGKYYMEVKLSGGTNYSIGVLSLDMKSQTPNIGYIGDGNCGNKAVGLLKDGNTTINGSETAGFDSIVSGDIVMIALDLDNDFVYFGKNGTWGNSGDPTSGASGTGARSITVNTNEFWGFGASVYANTVYGNFGNGYFGTTAVSTPGTNASGNGIFEYDVPTGYTALSTKGLNL